MVRFVRAEVAAKAVVALNNAVVTLLISTLTVAFWLASAVYHMPSFSKLIQLFLWYSRSFCVRLVWFTVVGISFMMWRPWVISG